MNYDFNEYLKKGDDLADLLFMKHPKLFKFIKYFILFFPVVIALLIFSARAHAASPSISLNSDRSLFYNSSSVSVVSSYFNKTKNNNYLIIQTSDYDYYGISGHLSKNNNIISGSDCYVVHYYRTQNNYNYTYYVSTSINNVSVNVGSYSFVSDLSGGSHLYSFEDSQINYNNGVFIMVFLFIIAFCELWRSLKRHTN